jgi:hypothetical protein
MEEKRPWGKIIDGSQNVPGKFLALEGGRKILGRAKKGPEGKREKGKDQENSFTVFFCSIISLLNFR